MKIVFEREKKNFHKMSSSSLSSHWDSSNDDLIDFFDSFLNPINDVLSSVNSPTSTIQDSVANSPTSILQDPMGSSNDFDPDPKYGSARIFLEKETHLFRHAREVKVESKGGYLEGKNFEILQFKKC